MLWRQPVQEPLSSWRIQDGKYLTRISVILVSDVLALEEQLNFRSQIRDAI
jgi:hypothetical protein